MIRIIDPERIGASLRNLRHLHQLSQIELASNSGLTQGQISDFERGQHVPSARTITAYANGLGYDLALVPREDTSQAEAHCDSCGGPCRDESDLEPAPSAATIASVTAIVDAPYREGVDVGLDDPQEPHAYLSTGCLHGEHGYCQNSTGAAGTKTPAQCKFCAAPCICDCHREEA